MNRPVPLKTAMSFHHGWEQVCRLHPAVCRTFFLLVLPMSLLPPIMLMYAGASHPLHYFLSAPPSRWNMVAAAFFLTELVTVPLMGWVIRSMASVHNPRCSFNDSFLLAALAALPIWASSIGLAIPNLWLMLAILVAGLLASASALYHGAMSVLKLDDEQAQTLSSSAFSVGGVVWSLLCAFVLLPLVG